MDLEGRIALVTGASSGLGRHAAGVLARAGARVVLCARRVDRLAEVQREIEVAGGEALAVSMDVADADSIRAAFESAQASLGVPGIVLNNAGTGDGHRALELTPDEFDHIVTTNLRGAWLVAQEAARRMRDGGKGGAIVNMASILAFRVAPGLAAYAATKAGLVQLTRALALELARHRIRVNALAPGYFETDMNRDYLQSDDARPMIERIPMRRVGKPEDLDGPLLLLASDAGRYLTGVVIPVDGGHLVSAL